MTSNSEPRTDRFPVSAVVLAGGRATRMGGADKGWVELAGRPLIDHVLDRLRPQVDEILKAEEQVHGNTPVTFAGHDLKDIPLTELYDQVAFVSQDNYLFDLSVMDNIRMGRKGASDAEVIDAAKKCGCHEFIMGLENGYQTVCGASGGHLSGGERQRISIARAMLKDAPIVILDEATSYTDPENEAVIQSALARLVRGKTLLVIAHRLSTIADADQIIVVNQGKIEATGTQAELLASCPLYQAMWEAHISVKDDGEVA